MNCPKRETQQKGEENILHTDLNPKADEHLLFLSFLFIFHYSVSIRVYSATFLFYVKLLLTFLFSSPSFVYQRRSAISIKVSVIFRARISASHRPTLGVIGVLCWGFSFCPVISCSLDGFMTFWPLVYGHRTSKNLPAKRASR